MGSAALLLASAVRAQAPIACSAASARTSPAAQARQYAQGLVTRWRMPGLQVAVGVDSIIVWSEPFGFADLEQSSPVTRFSRFSIGSVSKLITAAATMRAYEGGLLDLDAPIHQYLPDLPSTLRGITARQLAGHLGGLRHYNQVESSTLSPNYPKRYKTATEALEIFINDTLVALPGTRYAYSSFGFNLLGAVLEGATHQPFLDYVREAVLTPLQMSATVPDHTDSIIANRTRGYWRQSDTSATLNYPPETVNYKWPSGGFLSSADDLVHFALAHARPGFLSAGTLLAMFIPQRLSNGEPTRVGIGWRIATDSTGRAFVQHGGAGSGARAFILLYPRERVAVAMLANIFAPFAEEEAQHFACLFTGR
jgi:CubicO group peptidase (beta-lactamase class C family)